jgi:hypothetical protein
VKPIFSDRQTDNSGCPDPKPSKYFSFLFFLGNFKLYKLGKLSCQTRQLSQIFLSLDRYKKDKFWLSSAACFDHSYFRLKWHHPRLNDIKWHICIIYFWTCCPPRVGRGPSKSAPLSKSAPCHISITSRSNLLFFVVSFPEMIQLLLLQQKITDLF